jgi:hypothetical protein
MKNLQLTVESDSGFAVLLNKYLQEFMEKSIHVKTWLPVQVFH